MAVERAASESGPTQKVCEACGQTFGCAAPQRGCWCEGVKLSDATRAELKARYSDCLCPECLAASQGARLSA